MANKKSWVKTLAALMLVLGMMVVGCDNGTGGNNLALIEEGGAPGGGIQTQTSLEGTWDTNDGRSITVSNPW